MQRKVSITQCISIQIKQNPIEKNYRYIEVTFDPKVILLSIGSFDTVLHKPDKNARHIFFYAKKHSSKDFFLK